MRLIAAVKRELKRVIAARLLRENREALRASRVFDRDRLSETLWDGTVGESGCLTMGGVDTGRLAREYGTPIHVVNVERLHRNLREFLSAFSDAHARVRLATSYKTNPVPAVLQKLHEWGTLAEVVSHFELWLALEGGLAGERIIFNGPGKSRESLELAVENRVWLINVDSHEELEELARICARRGRRQNIGIRVTAEVGWESQFGLAVRSGSAFRAFQAASQATHLNPVGIHLHLGTGIGSIDTYVRGISEALQLARAVKREIGVRLSVLDLGGGFGVPTTRVRTPWDERLQRLGMPIRTAVPSETPTAAAYGLRIVPLVNQYLADVGSEGAELIFEPGRAITSSTQMLLLSALRVKRTDRSSADVILDGGHNLCAPLAWEFHEILPVNRMQETSLQQQNLYGPLCHPHDVVALNKPLPRLSAGDIIAVMDAGAYFITSQRNFSHPRPGIVAVENGSIRWMRRAESFTDVVALDNRETLVGRAASPDGPHA